MGITKIQMLLIVKKITFYEKMQYMPTFCLIYSKLIYQIRCPGILIGMFETIVFISNNLSFGEAQCE